MESIKCRMAGSNWSIPATELSSEVRLMADSKISDSGTTTEQHEREPYPQDQGLSELSPMEALQALRAAAKGVTIRHPKAGKGL